MAVEGLTHGRRWRLYDVTLWRQWMTLFLGMMCKQGQISAGSSCRAILPRSTLCEMMHWVGPQQTEDIKPTMIQRPVSAGPTRHVLSPSDMWLVQWCCPLDTRRFCDVKSTSMTLIERRNNLVYPVGSVMRHMHYWNYNMTELIKTPHM